MYIKHVIYFSLNEAILNINKLRNDLKWIYNKLFTHVKFNVKTHALITWYVDTSTEKSYVFKLYLVDVIF